MNLNGNSWNSKRLGSLLLCRHLIRLKFGTDLEITYSFYSSYNVSLDKIKCWISFYVTKDVLRSLYIYDYAAAKSFQSCPTLCDPIDGSPPGSPVPGILQPRTLEWVAISFSNAWKWKVKVKSLSHAWLLATPWTAAFQAPLSMDFQGKSTGVGCHCLLQYINICGSISEFHFSILTPGGEKW